MTEKCFVEMDILNDEGVYFERNGYDIDKSDIILKEILMHGSEAMRGNFSQKEIIAMEKKWNTRTLIVGKDKHMIEFDHHREQFFVINKIELKTMPENPFIVIKESFDGKEFNYKELARFKKGSPVEFEMEETIGIEDWAKLYISGDDTAEVRVIGEYVNYEEYEDLPDEEFTDYDDSDYDE